MPKWNGNELATVYFQSRKLPPYAIVLDVAANNPVFGAFDEELAVWFWRFTVCVGRTRDEQSPVVLKHASVLADKLRGEGHLLVPELSKRFPDADASTILRDWMECLSIICEEAQKAQKCEWWAE